MGKDNGVTGLGNYSYAQGSHEGWEVRVSIYLPGSCLDGSLTRLRRSFIREAKGPSSARVTCPSAFDRPGHERSGPNAVGAANTGATWEQ